MTMVVPLPYTPPPWSGTPMDGMPYTLEIVKQGTILDTVHLESLCSRSGRAFCTLGRAPTSDIVLDHPSSSRLHLVIQFRGEDGAAFLFDPGSTHGTFLNKQRLATEQYHPFRVGDQLRMGESSRIYILGGPSHLLPETDARPLREQRRQASETVRAPREIKRARLDDAKQGPTEVTWGMADFDHQGAEDGDFDDFDDWRELVNASKIQLSDKQQKMVERIRSKEIKISNWQKEIDRIEAKEKDGLSAGQQDALFRNRQSIDVATEELEELEEALIESLRGNRKQAKGDKQQQRVGVGDEDLGEDSEDEEYYDRTGGGRKRRHKYFVAQRGEEAEDAPSLLAKLRALLDERQKELSNIRVLSKLEENRGNDGRVKQEDQKTPTDALDEFMLGVSTDLQKDSAKRQCDNLEKLEARIAETKRLLTLADPEGYYYKVDE